ncbi:thiopurine S-methyltransferase [Kordiimonas sp. SCSIO 12603]|uniref:thiopurine S-methyltransferase n=1 Tax=Kordiimonas sp. SCSIO 12603 TaxID=2829596 RepID=UPI00210526E1|nr:thiopurine S-methyltransferase [Kordiimonas sp. SCSIO 12603]UTW60248.1 thiopurine S-methyltransferase [Kordiimonas sp. SCSIO 12603]
MDEQFWHQKWAKNEIRFHLSEANPKLVKYFGELKLYENSRIFLPLCGKTKDIGWLLSNGHSVVGAELSEAAITQLFEELELEPTVTAAGSMKLYSAENIDIYVGNIFDLTDRMLGLVDAVFDRGALVALPAEMRKRYAAHIIDITEGAHQLLICLEYDPALRNGPPFPITDTEVTQHYFDTYQLKLLVKDPLPHEEFDISPVTENAWLLKNK